MLSPRYIIGFTGHRSGINHEAVKTSLTRVLGDITQRAGKVGGQAELFGSAAEGSDVICVEAARELHLPVHLILPLEEAEFFRDFSSPASIDRSRRQIEISRQDRRRDSIRIAPGETTRPECFFNLAMVMLQSCDVLIAVHDGQRSRGVGGTADVVAHAKTMTIPTIVIDPKSGAIRWDDSIDAVIRPDPRMEKLRELAIVAEAPGAGGAADPAALQACLDHIAMVAASRFRPSTVRIIMLQGVATLLAALAGYTFPSPAVKPVLAGFEMALVCMALWMTLGLKRRQIRERWVDSRFACELLRGLSASLPLLDPLDPLDPLIARHHSEWRRFALSAALLVQNHATTFDPLELRDRYLRGRLGEKGDESQVLHFERRSRAAQRSWKLSGVFGDWAARLAPIFVLISLTYKVYRLWHPSGHLPSQGPFPLWLAASFLPIAFPLAAGAAGGFRQALDAGRRVHRYPEMVLRLKMMRQWLPGLETLSTIRTAVSRCEALLLDELEEWRVVAKGGDGH